MFIVTEYAALIEPSNGNLHPLAVKPLIMLILH